MSARIGYADPPDMARASSRGRGVTTRFPPVPQVPIAAVLEALGATDVPRMGRGRTKKIRCPFHDDTRPSASVGEFSFVCWSCGKTGDAISLLMSEEGTDFKTALARAASLAGIPCDAVPPERQGRWSGSIFDL